MKKSFISLATMFALGSIFFSCQTNVKEANYNVIPAPLEVVQGQDGAFVLTDGTKIFYPEGNAKMQRNAEFLAEFIAENMLTLTMTGKDFESIAAVLLQLF